MEEQGSVSLKEYLDMQIDFVNKELIHIREKIQEEKELHTAKSDASKEALELQAEKYEQRLTALNHEAQRLQLMVTREMFEEVTNSIRAKVSILEEAKSRQEGKASVANVIAIISLAVAIMAILLRLWK